MRKIIMMSVLFLLFITGIMIYLGNEGYCYKTGKFFDETPIQERIDKILMQHILSDGKQPRMVSYFGQGMRIDPIIYYKNLEEFKKINPDCCKFYRYSDDIMDFPLARITGEIYGIIDIDYLVFRYYSGFVPNNGFEFNNGLEFPLVEKEGYIYFISRCGETRSFFDFW